MAPEKFNDNNPSTSNARDHGDRALDANAHDQILLKALKEFVVPLVQTVVEPMGMKAVDFKGPEAMNLITALKEFVSTIVGGTVHVEETPRKIRIKKYATRNRNNGNNIITRFNEVESLSRTSPNWYAMQDEMFRTKLLNELQEHISNKMPIRLLLIEPHDSFLRISLIERGAIYGHLANIVKALQIPINSLRSQQMVEEFIESTIKSYAKYAILSHKWLRGTPGEITYDHWNKGLLNPESDGYQKLAGFCRIAWKDYGITLAWMDTVCINKDSSSELDESIRSMYAWYERAEMCIIYLSETKTIPEIQCDTWFTRGWTLQELLAPKAFKFYSSEWIQLAQGTNDRENSVILSIIQQKTTISYVELRNITITPFSRRMQWAASREVTREEDMAYALMGIFNVSISIAYGEGAERAFLRLLEEIMKTAPSGAMDLFNWAGKSNSSRFNTSLLPSIPKYYLSRSTNVMLQSIINSDPLALTPRGIRIPVILMPGVPTDPRDSPFSVLVGKYGAIAEISWPLDNFDRRIPTTYCLLHETISGPDQLPDQGVLGNKPQLTFAVLNFRHTATTRREEYGIPAIRLQKTCISVVLLCKEPAGKVTDNGMHPKLSTAKPVVFELKSGDWYKRLMHSYSETNPFAPDFVIPVDELASHGMQLVSLYL